MTTIYMYNIKGIIMMVYSQGYLGENMYTAMKFCVL